MECDEPQISHAIYLSVVASCSHICTFIHNRSMFDIKISQPIKLSEIQREDKLGVEFNDSNVK